MVTITVNDKGNMSFDLPSDAVSGSVITLDVGELVLLALKNRRFDRKLLGVLKGVEAYADADRHFRIANRRLNFSIGVMLYASSGDEDTAETRLTRNDNANLMTYRYLAKGKEAVLAELEKVESYNGYVPLLERLQKPYGEGLDAILKGPTG